MHLNLKPIPNENAELAGFTKRRIRKINELNTLTTTLELLIRFSEDEDALLISELTDLVHALHRTVWQVQKVKQDKLLKKLKRISPKTKNTQRS